LLDSSARMVRDSGLHARNVERIAQALGFVTQVEFEIYQARPDLMPDYLKRELGDKPNP
jgi:hypothetical protein